MEELALGVALGFSAGISPGPLLALVLSGTLRGGLAIGLRVAAVPLLTDLPVIVLTVAFMAVLPDAAIAGGGVAGGAFLGWLGVSTLRDARTARLPTPDEAVAGGAVTDGAVADGAVPDGAVADGTVTDGAVADGAGGGGSGSEPAGPGLPAGRRALWQGAVANLLSPHPWMFWITTGAPLLVAAWRHGSAQAAGFLFGFYALLVGSKVLLAVVVARARGRIGTRGFRLLLAGAGVLLLAAAGLLLAEFGTALLGDLTR